LLKLGPRIFPSQTIFNIKCRNTGEGGGEDVRRISLHFVKGKTARNKIMERKKEDLPPYGEGKMAPTQKYVNKYLIYFTK
jgi:hypothetical protein